MGTGRPAGARTRKSGAAPRSRWAAPCPSHTIATRGILIGRLDGVQTRRSGAAPTSRWGARRSVAIEHPAPDIPPLHALFGGVLVSTEDRLLLQERPQRL